MTAQAASYTTGNASVPYAYFRYADAETGTHVTAASVDFIGGRVCTEEGTPGASKTYVVSSSVVFSEPDISGESLYVRMFDQYRRAAGNRYASALAAFYPLAGIARSLPVKDFFIGYSENSSTVDFRLLLDNGLLVALSKSAQTAGDGMAAYLIQYGGHTLGAGVMDAGQFRTGMARVIKDLGNV